MEILKSEQYISEKLNIKPVSKDRLDKYSAENIRSALEVAKATYREKIDIAVGEGFEANKYQNVFTLGFHFDIDQKFNAGILLIKPNDYECEIGRDITYNPRKNANGLNVTEVELNKFHNYSIAAYVNDKDGKQYISINDTFIFKFLEYYEQNHSKYFTNIETSCEFAPDEGGCGWIGACYDPRKHDFDKFVKQFADGVLSIVSQYIIDILDKIFK